MRARPGPFRSRRLTLTLVAPVLLLLLAACGSGGDGPTVATVGESGSAGGGSAAAGSSTADREKALREFAQCIRDNGVADFPDPTVDANGNVRMGEGAPNLRGNDPSTRQAMTACESRLGSIRQNFTPEQQQQVQDALLAYARCMRENGFQMADPDFSGAGRGALRALRDVNRNDPAFTKADAVCRPKTLGNLPGRGGASRPPTAG